MENERQAHEALAWVLGVLAFIARFGKARE
jgi:hypothetical protein